jgi:hypothetical protein
METFDSNPALIRKLIGQTSPTGWENRKGIIRKGKTRKIFQTGKQLSKASPVKTSVMTRKLQRIFWHQKNQNSDRQGNRTETGESGKKAQKNIPATVHSKGNRPEKQFCGTKPERLPRQEGKGNGSEPGGNVRIKTGSGLGKRTDKDHSGRQESQRKSLQKLFLPAIRLKNSNARSNPVFGTRKSGENTGNGIIKTALIRKSTL